MFDKRKKDHLFGRQLVNYIVLVGFLFISITVLFVSIREKYKNQVEENSLSSLRHVVEGLDTRLGEVSAIASEIVTNDGFRVYSFMQSNGGQSDFSFLYDIFNGIPSYPQVNDVIYDTIAYFYDSESFLSPIVVSNRSETFYNTYMKYEDLSYEEWQTDVKEGPYRDKYWKTSNVETSNTLDQNIITFLRYFNDVVSPKGVLSIMVDRDRLFEQIDLSVVGEDGAFYIMDKYTSEIIASHQPQLSMTMTLSVKEKIPEAGMEVEIDDRNYYVIQIEAADQPLTYVAFISIGSMMAEVQEATVNSIILFAVILLVAVTLSMIFTYLNIKPVREIIRILADSDVDLVKDESGEYSFIKGGISRLIEENTDLSTNLEREQLILRSVFISRLLLNEYKDDSMVKLYLDKSGIVLEDDNYVLLTCKTFLSTNGSDQLDAIDALRISIASILRQKLGLNTYIQNMEVDKVVIIISYPKTVYYEEIQIKLEKIAMDFIEAGDPIMFAMSQQYKSLIDTPVHYSSNNELLRTCFPKKLNIIYSTDLNETDDRNYFGREDQDKFASLIRMGEGNSAYELIEKVIMDYHAIPSVKLRQTLMSIKNTLEKVEISGEVQFDMKSYYLSVSLLMKSMTVKQYLSNLLISIGMIAGHYQSTKESSNTALRDRIIDYVSENVSNHELCLAMIADALSASEKYISRYFKDQTGQNLIAYIEELRMKKAIEMILNTDMPLKLIADEVGYVNNNTFYKAFKRKYGISPGEYRRTRK